MALVVTCAVVAGLGIWFAVAKWDQADKVAAAASALGALAAVGVAVWAALRTAQGGPTGRIRVMRTGKATATGPGSSATSGLHGRADSGQAEALDTGDARAVGGGTAVSGVQVD